jgi:preprotein translocase subunit SecF
MIKMHNLIAKRTKFVSISALLLIAALVALTVFGLKSGIEFSSGSQLTLSFEQNVEISDLKNELDNLGYGNAIVQETGEGNFILRTEQLTPEDKNALKVDLANVFSANEELGFENVDPVIAKQTTRTAAIAVSVAAMGILLYITWAFRRMPKPLHYGSGAIIALVHDAVIALGVFAIVGAILNWEINMMFIIGILAVIGYSVNNTVVIFDRIRENLLKEEKLDFEQVINKSLAESFSRSLNTSITTIIVMLALLLFVGSAIQNFAVVMIVGITAGTFSSLFIAPSILVIWERNEWSKLLPMRKTES